MDYWEILTECMAKCWVVTLGANPEHPDEHYSVTIRNWRSGAFWSVFGPTWEDVFGKIRERIRQD